MHRAEVVFRVAVFNVAEFDVVAVREVAVPSTVALRIIGRDRSST
jgi:hypothetical protein